MSGPTNGAFVQGASNGIRLLDVRDGTSITLLVGEKHVPLDKWGVGWWDCSLYNGDYPLCSSRPAGVDFPLARSLRDQGMVFGSYHPQICQFAFCDGHVAALPVSISPRTLGLLANREDGEVIPEY